jgi:hypothetical protein
MVRESVRGYANQLSHEVRVEAVRLRIHPIGDGHGLRGEILDPSAPRFFFLIALMRSAVSRE